MKTQDLMQEHLTKPINLGHGRKFMMLSISVVICTRNRISYLRSAVNSVILQASNSPLAEVIVVDNGSTDSTADFVRSLCPTFPNVKYIFEPSLGLSHARNSGLRAAQGQYIAFLDDDAVAEDGWLSQIPIAFETGGGDIACVGGKIEPIWGKPRPTWLHDDLLGYVSAFDYFPVPVRMPENIGPWGCNVVFRRDVLRRLGGFSTALGRKGALLLSNVEFVVYRQLRELGFSIYYDPKICVRHWVNVDRLSKAWFKRRAYWQGVSDSMLDVQSGASSKLAMGRRRLRQLASLLYRPKRLLAAAFPGDDPQSFTTACYVYRTFGYVGAVWHGWRT
jgi:glycosyltransferase involved in cell wall biosynthesis